MLCAMDKPASPGRRRALATLASSVAVTSFAADRQTDRIVELRLYKLKPGTRERFDSLVREAVPMLLRDGITVLGHGPSRHDADSYYIVRAYPSLEKRAAQLEAFYGSKEWKDKYDAVVMGMIETYNTVVLDAGDAAIAGIARLAAR